MAEATPLGIDATCRACGGENARTGRTRTEPLTGLGPDVEYLRSEELVCGRCGRRMWIQTGTAQTPGAE
jgi:hypothetical protein